MGKNFFSKKTLSILLTVLLSAGLIASAYIYQQKSSTKNEISNSSLPEGDWMTSLQVIPDDATSTITTVQRGLMGVDVSTSTTDRIGRDLLMEYALTQNAKSGDILSDFEVQAITNRLIQKTRENIEPPYTEKDLRIVSNTPENTTKYFASVNTIITNFYKSYTMNETIFVVKALNDQAPDILDPLGPRIQKYKDLEKNLLDTKTPENISAVHLELVRGYASVRITIEGMYGIFSDPIRGLNALSDYRKATQALVEIADKYKKLTITNN